MALTKKQLKDVCLLHQGHRQCRYLMHDDQSMNVNGWNCLKMTAHKKVIDQEVSEALGEQKKQKIDIKKKGYPIGNNCSGYPLLKLIDQGYDV